MTTRRVQTNRSFATGVRPAASTRKAGELYANLADLQLTVIDAGQAPRDLLAIRFFNTTAGYAAGSFVVNSGALYVSNATVAPGAFNPDSMDEDWAMMHWRHWRHHPPPVVNPPPPPSGSGALAPPAGYTTSELTFQDQFTSPALNTANWNPYMALNGIRWQGANDILLYPYSAIGNAGANNAEYGDPFPYGASADNGAGVHMTGGGTNGLRLIASPDTHEPGYAWAGAYVSGTEKLAVLPATGGYVQIRAEMPDSTHGGWGSLWLMPENHAGQEMDLQETGFTSAGIPVNQQMASSIHSGPEKFSNVGVDISAGFHTYGLAYDPGVSVKTYFDGALQQSWTTGVPTGAYELIMSMTMWGGSPSLHTAADPVAHPGPYTMSVNDVQIYRRP